MLHSYEFEITSQRTFVIFALLHVVKFLNSDKVDIFKQCWFIWALIAKLSAINVSV